VEGQICDETSSLLERWDREDPQVGRSAWKASHFWLSLPLWLSRGGPLRDRDGTCQDRPVFFSQRVLRPRVVGTLRFDELLFGRCYPAFCRRYSAPPDRSDLRSRLHGFRGGPSPISHRKNWPHRWNSAGTPELRRPVHQVPDSVSGAPSMKALSRPSSLPVCRVFAEP
jgi:hypothetical protein